MRYLHIAISLPLVMSLWGCGGGVKPDDKEAPDWLGGESARYGAAHYLLGRGSDAQLDNAKDRARADLAKTFQVAVSEESRDVQTVRQQSGETGVRQSGELNISRAIQTRTGALIRGIEIAGIWRDPATRQYHALAVLPRAQAARGLRQDIQELDDATERYLRQAREQDDPLRKIALADKAVNAQSERAGYQRMLRVVDISGQGSAPRWNPRELENDLDTLLARLRIAPQASGDAALDEAVRGAIADAGFQAVQNEAADYTLAAAVNLEDLGQRQGWYWYTGKLDVTLRDSGGHVRGTRQWFIKESATMSALARQRAEDKAVEILKKELRQTLLEFPGK